MSLTNHRRIGLIAGWGRFPVVVAETLQRNGWQVHCLGILGHADSSLEKICHDYRSMSLTRMGGHVRYFRRHRVRTATFAGKVHKVKFFRRDFFWRHLPDMMCVRTFFPHFVSGTRNRNDDALLTAAVEGYGRAGIEIVSATDLVPNLLIPGGQMSGERLSASLWRDVRFGWELAKQMGELDVGQSVAVKGRAVLAVEAVEGTDACIRRAGQLCPSGNFTVVKVAKPRQDMRFDVPTIGLGTVQTMAESGARVLVVEADKTILVDQREVCQFAASRGITLLALRAGQVLGATEAA